MGRPYNKTLQRKLSKKRDNPQPPSQETEHETRPHK